MRRCSAGLALLAALVVGCSGATSSGPVRGARTPSPSAAASPGPNLGAGAVRGVYGKDSSGSGHDVMAGTGFNTVDVAPYREYLDQLTTQHLQGLVWLGQWDRQACRFENDDAWIRTHVAAIAGHPAIAAYFLADEPQVTGCPQAPAALKARSQLVKSLDPGHPTYTVIQISDGSEQYAYQHWTDTTDILGFDVYPCNRSAATCDFQKIDQAVAAAARYGITRYWAVIQDFEDSYYRLPTPEQLRQQFEHWRHSQMSGYFVFSWNYKGVSLESHPDTLSELRIQNSAALAGAAPATVASKKP